MTERAATFDVERLAEALHDAMCDVSHHDRDRRCTRWAKYPHIAASTATWYERRAALAAQPKPTEENR